MGSLEGQGKDNHWMWMWKWSCFICRLYVIYFIFIDRNPIFKPTHTPTLISGSSLQYLSFSGFSLWLAGSCYCGFGFQLPCFSFYPVAQNHLLFYFHEFYAVIFWLMLLDLLLTFYCDLKYILTNSRSKITCLPAKSSGYSFLKLVLPIPKEWFICSE